MSKVLSITRSTCIKQQLFSTFSLASACCYYYCLSVTSTTTTASFVTTTLFIKPTTFISSNKRILFHSSSSKLYRTTTTTSTSNNKMSLSDSSSNTNRQRKQQQSSSPPAHVVVVGSANYDMTVYTNTIPQIGETVLGDKFQTSCGGKGANQAIAAACLVDNNNTKTSIVCRVGNDVFGQSLITNFQSKHVHINTESCILKSEDDNKDSNASSGVACITVDTTTGDNCIIVAPGANGQLSPEDVREQLIQLHPTVVLVQLEIPYTSALEALKIGKEVGAITILNPAPAPKDVSLLNDLYNYIDIIVPNESELRTLCGDDGTTESSDHNDDEEGMAKALFEKGISRAVIVTLGARGAMVVTRNNIEDKNSTIITTTYCTQPDNLPCKDEPIIDTIGAGDGFCGALASYLSSGVTDLAYATELACGLASMSIRRSGASYPSPQEIPVCLRIPIITKNKSLLPPPEQEQQQSQSTILQQPKSKPTITFVTGNKNKLIEVQAILSKGSSEELPFNLLNEKIDLPELQGNDTIEIAIEKCKLAAQKCSVGGAVITEDTSLCFNALNGMPGPYIKWFLENCGHNGLNKMLDGFNDRTAYALTVVAYTAGGTNSDVVHVFEGRTDGTIVLPRGSLDFGWDPIFQPFEYDGTRTYAEMSKDEKNTISHRSRAFAKLRDFLLQQKQEQ